MIFSVSLAGEVTYPQSEQEVVAAIGRLAALPYWKYPARFAYSFGPVSSFADVCSFVLVTLDSSSGYGGLIWGVTKKYPTRKPPFDNLWVSDSREPPTVDPRVLSDAHVPAYFDRCSVLPSSQVAMALKEYYRNADGSRPESIDWVVAISDNGMRLDRTE